MEVTYSIPIWQILLFIIAVGWALIKMFFKQKTHTIELASHKDDIKSIKKDLEEKIDRHKIANDQSLKEINNIVVETKTLVQLLVQDKIK